ncbi:hypothetical protein [Pseudomonas frederiksbergensis]|uniref:Uncharacterized protein n=1 Tax=Pseudomonas frederiksbergensis TaxID=104087 RepID=A0A6L5BXQ9_9PSED|nr:hypothetical protein [Pseudomonas frederiksbergensis]KAF2393128.1 hypothetical protein FX983_01089 [Pseudomonas frederiksbergensis]
MMYALCLSPDARSQLLAQATQNGTFLHHFFADDVRRATAVVAIEQDLEAVSVQVRLGSTVNSLTIPNSEDVAERIACFLEELAICIDPRMTPDADAQLTISILEPNAKRLFSQSIEGYRSANAELDAAIEKENWGAIHIAQSRRDLHASTIALIVNKCSVGVEVGVRP